MKGLSSLLVGVVGLEDLIEPVTRTKVFYRLNLLIGEGKIKGKFTGPGKGAWIWWGVNSFQTKT